VQFGILDQAAKHPDLTTYTDNVRLLQALASVGFMSKENADLLKAAYCLYRDYGHKLVLQGDRTVIDQIEVAALSRQVEQLWHGYMED
jgi:glutamate-ammonia-ligase adenylyltransferase